MFYREIVEKLNKWHNEPKKKALCIIGARQVGKTTIIREFAKNNYECFIEINFISDKNASKIFDGNLDATNILLSISAYTDKKMISGKTLIFFDEIEECPNARTAIKFLVEDGRYDYIESGSELGVEYKHVKSYPVGFEKIIYMYPMNFYEFLLACDIKEETIDILRVSYENIKPINEVIFSKIKDLFLLYIIVGGMPEVLTIYKETNDLNKVFEKQVEIIELYKKDITKYSKRQEIEKIKDIFESIPAELNKKNRRYIITDLGKNKRFVHLENSFLWLSDAGVSLPCYNLDEPKVPIKLSEDRSLFKLYMGDTGLLLAIGSLYSQFDILKNEESANLGGVFENVIAKELKINGYNLHYYDKKNFAEVDFVLDDMGEIDLVEVKSGKDNMSHISIDKVRSKKGWKFRKSIVLSRYNVKLIDDIIYYPWFMVMFMKPKEKERLIFNM